MFSWSLQGFWSCPREPEPWSLALGRLCAPEVRRQSPGKHRQEDRVRSHVPQGLWEPAEQGWLGCGGKVGLLNLF